MRKRLVAISLLLGSGWLGAVGNELSTDYRESGKPAVVDDVRPLPPPIPCCPPPIGGDELAQLVTHVSVMSPYSYGALSVYPIRRERGWGDALRPQTLDGALRRGCLDVMESGYGDVNQLRLRNRCGQYVFLLAGENIYGGKQDRFVAQDGLLAPYGPEVVLPVYCSEHGRWDDRPGIFKPGAALASPDLRRKMLSEESQQSVWDQVAREAHKSGADSSTGRYGAIFDRREAEHVAAPYKDRIGSPILGQRGIIGAVFVLGGRIVGADLFAGEDLFRAEFPKLLTSHALQSWPSCDRCGLPSDTVEGFLRSFASPWSVTDVGTYGVGRRYQASASAGTAQVLAFDREVVHASLMSGGVPIDPWE